MADEERRDADNLPFNPKQHIWIDKIISAHQASAGSATGSGAQDVHPHQFQRCSLYSLLHHNQVRWGVVWVNTYQKVIAKPDGLVYTQFSLAVIVSAHTAVPILADSLWQAGSTSNTGIFKAREHP